jgi:hypothetical protein
MTAVLVVGAALALWVVGSMTVRVLRNRAAPHTTFVIVGERVGIRQPSWADQLADEAEDFLRAHR